MELLDLNDDCLEYLLKFCDTDSLIASSQTCKKLNGIGARLFKSETSYDCRIESEEDTSRIKRTIATIGKYLIDLQFTDYGHRKLSGAFFGRLSQRCPNLRKLRIVSFVLPNLIISNIHTLHQLEFLAVRRGVYVNGNVNRLSAVRLARRLEQLQSFECEHFVN